MTFVYDQVILGTILMIVKTVRLGSITEFCSNTGQMCALCVCDIHYEPARYKYSGKRQAQSTTMGSGYFPLKRFPVKFPKTRK